MASFGTIYSYLNNPRVMKAQAAANLNGLALTIPAFEMGKANRTPEFLAKFPFGKVPALEGTDGSILVESDAITQYIAESGPASAQLLGPTPLQRAQIRQWIVFADGEIMAPVLDILLPRAGLRAFDAEKEKAAVEKLERSLGRLEEHVKGKKWIASSEEQGLSLADITVASSLSWGFGMTIDAEMRARCPAVVEWFKRTVESEGVKRAFGEQKLVEKRETHSA